MIASGVRRLGVGPFVLVFAGLAVISLLLSRGAGSGWLVVVASAYLGVLVIALAWSLVGLVGIRVDFVGPTDAIVGETVAVDLTVRSLVPQLRTAALLSLDGSTHLINGSRPNRVHVQASRRCLLHEITIEIRGGLPLGLFRFPVRRRVTLPVPLAVAPVAAACSLLDALGEDAAAEVRGVRPYVAGDPARLVHWRSTARRAELMVRELESAELLRGAALDLRVTLPDDVDRAEALASEACGFANAALDAGLRVRLATCDGNGPVVDEVTSRRAVGRRLAAAETGEPPAVTSSGLRSHVVELPR